MNTILLVDASGSMSPHVAETQMAIEQIINNLPSKTHLEIIFFDSMAYKCVAKGKPGKIKTPSYFARGGTPITDSLYKTIQDKTDEVKNIKDLAGGYKVVLYCDGGENSSIHVTVNELAAAIDHMTKNFFWDFQFIGPKSKEKYIRQYTDSIKIKPDNVTLYASMTEGLQQMRDKVLNK